jgi:hypothetical protein
MVVSAGKATQSRLSMNMANASLQGKRRRRTDARYPLGFGRFSARICGVFGYATSDL